MAKKASGKTYTSKGERKNVSSKTLNVIKGETKDLDRVMNVQQAYLDGKNPYVTIANPNPNETAKKFIRVRANEIMGHPKERIKKMFIMV